MIGVQDIRNGTAFLLDGQPWIGIKYEHIKMGRGSATIKIKMRNLLTGAIIEKAFINSARVEEIDLVRKPMQFLYKDGESFVFMDPKSYEQVGLDGGVVAENEQFLKEGITANILFWDERPLLVELPPKMEFEVVECDSGIKGNSVSNLFKGAKLDSGMTARVPLFIEVGDKILIDTRDGSYSERVK
ncbi:elongation factor P [Candidatus Amesbacteria bacterium RIFCSPLOWO2_01_FULL_49_25]|uniref:Elongation factor P n=1 Tax=Candidatus Amesbacteria bacterium RIFCSPHIGHO2_01_FULL_48_32b TaxID=1797253 RepID=A0A1F4YF52_9BACT|nr:MAG: elongation factor P [Candidatus Amesbacteria bacterium RIFCSPHIGHO2_01_FULL_48_32b]OGD07602.1 MAG: elongation factor P [Candidatus Amesbacteria bacterium RIFCSPLOWO2_01_FULL_49_25]